MTLSPAVVVKNSTRRDAKDFLKLWMASEKTEQATRITELRRAAFKTNAQADRDAYFDALSAAYQTGELVFADAALSPQPDRSAVLAEGFGKGLEAACDVIDAYSEYDQSLCCSGRECGCMGTSVHSAMQHYIRALQDGTAAEQFDLEEVAKTLQFYADVSKYPAPLTGGLGDLYYDCGERARAALARIRGTDHDG